MEALVHDQECELESFVRTRYFHGQLLEVQQFEGEQRYLNEKRWLINRLVLGYGVVCGLNVKADAQSVRVTAGVALDQAGREIIVPCTSKPIPVPPRPPREEQPEPRPEQEGGYDSTDEEGEDRSSRDEDYDRDEDKEKWMHLVICFHECHSDPAPIEAGECDADPDCEYGAVRERYRLELRPGRLRSPYQECRLKDLVRGGRIDYRGLVEAVSQGCPEVPADRCLPLANIRRPWGDDELSGRDIRISVRYIVFTNDLLYELIHGVVWESPRQGHKR
jgi:hypothetical protein